MVRAGEYDVTLRFTCPETDAGSVLSLTLGGVSREIKVTAFEPKEVRLPHRDEAGHVKYVNREWGELPVGRFKLGQGPVKLTIEATSKPAAAVLDLKGVVLNAAE